MILIWRKIIVKKLLSKIFKKKEKDSAVQPTDNVVSQNDIISFRQGFDLTELPVVSLYHNDMPFNFLLDTGSNDSIIDSNALDRMEYTLLDREGQLYGMEGNAETVKVCNIVLSYNGKDYPYEYNIRDMSVAFSNIKAETGVTLHGIIGSKFFNKYKYVLDFELLVAYSKK